jgi:hypothetical protein
MIKNSDLNTLKEFLAFANTPFYLFKHFRKHAVVQDIGENQSFEKIKKIIETKANKLQTVNDLIILYAYIISLTMHNSNKSIKLLQNLKNKHKDIKWIPSITSLTENSQDNTGYSKKIDLIGIQKPKVITKSIPSDVHKTIYEKGGF